MYDTWGLIKKKKFKKLKSTVGKILVRGLRLPRSRVYTEKRERIEK